MLHCGSHFKPHPLDLGVVRLLAPHLTSLMWLGVVSCMCHARSPQVHFLEVYRLLTDGRTNAYECLAQDKRLRGVSKGANDTFLVGKNTLQSMGINSISKH